MRPTFSMFTATFATVVCAMTTSSIVQASEFADPQLNQLALILPGSDFGSRGPIVKSCFVKLQPDPKGKAVYMNVMVVAVNESISAIVSQRIEGERNSNMAWVEAEFSLIRPGLNAKSNADDDTLNGGERLILHAMATAAEPDLRATFQSGVDLEKVRQTKVFYIDRNPGDMGSAAVVEALDENGKVLGSFLGGFLVARCK
jgi:hypothetical protein